MTDNFAETLPFIPPKAFDELIFIKLGGSLITSKDEAYKANTPPLLGSLLEQIRDYLIQFPPKKTRAAWAWLWLVWARCRQKYGTRDGVFDPPPAGKAITACGKKRANCITSCLQVP